MNIYQKLMNALSNGEYSFQTGKLRNCDFAECDQETDTITVDSVNVISEVVIHELLHAFYPEKGEKFIEDKTARTFLRLNRKQKFAIVKAFMKRIKEGK